MVTRAIFLSGFMLGACVGAVVGFGLYALLGYLVTRGVILL